jgi:hypothetical protein
MELMFTVVGDICPPDRQISKKAGFVIKVQIRTAITLCTVETMARAVIDHSKQGLPGEKAL